MSVKPRAEAPKLKARRSPSHQDDSEGRPSECSITRDFYTPARSLNLLAFEGNIQSTFFVANALSKLDFGQSAITAMWETMSAPDDPSKRALETALFGRFHRQPGICEASSRWYGRALIKLSDDLRTPQALWSTAVLRSAIILTMYELIAATSSHGWIHHAGAISRLLEARGPYRHQSFEERSLLEAARPLVIARAAVEAKRSFLERPDWLQIPWALNLDQKSLREKLVDLSCVIPGMIENRRELARRKQSLARLLANHPGRKHHSQQIERYRCVASALVVRCGHLLDDVRTWKQFWDRQSNPVTLLHFPSGTPSYPDYPEDLFGPPLSFYDLYEANHVAMYYQVLTSLLRLTYECHYEASPAASETTDHAIDSSLFLKPGIDLPLTDHDELLVERRKCAIEVCRSVPYHLSTELHGCGGAYVIMLPLLMARPIFRPQAEEAKYIDRVLTHLAGTWGNQTPQWFG
ncbi:MAG: hypothetical protein L6R42_002207 [Xanthoria sp. 1 TBL-2021]|nr:MAG: hypothetical protein L6R42_002207 [Xanthoria sp. 1 TBL-2021]